MSDSAAQTYAAALAWIAANPQPWGRFVDYARTQAERGQRISTQLLVEDIRAHDYVNRLGKPCKVNNSHAPIFARELCRQYPECRPFLKLRRSRFDALYNVRSDYWGVQEGGPDNG